MQVQTEGNGRQVVPVQANYNFTHALYHTCEPRVLQRGERNNHACKFKFTQLCITMQDFYTSRFHACAIYSLVCKLRLVAGHRYLLSGGTLSIYEATKDLISQCYKCFSKCQIGAWLYLRLSLIYEICIVLFF